MKKLAILFMIVLFVACGKDKNEVQKPEKLLTPEQMADVLYDLAILQATNSYSPKLLQDADIKNADYIYGKYKIDSLVFTQNHKYYAGDLEMYEMIQGTVSDRLKKDKAAVDAELNKENPDNKPKDSIAKK
ncbi:MAG: DUF4296 domain-containing protein [Flavobacterium sp.]|nr:MAG: DUF4296 domain-containing protein [Flavobacterium sp.]